LEVMGWGELDGGGGVPNREGGFAGKMSESGLLVRGRSVKGRGSLEKETERRNEGPKSHIGNITIQKVARLDRNTGAGGAGSLKREGKREGDWEAFWEERGLKKQT